MSWKLRNRIRSYLRSSLWIIPVFAGMAERIFRALVEVIEAHTGWSWFELGIDGAKAHLAFVEIRFYGASNIQIARRLRAMIINLANTLPAVRHAALQQELDLLDRALGKLYVFSEDLALARIPDTQGLGGSTDATAPKWASAADQSN